MWIDIYIYIHKYTKYSIMCDIFVNAKDFGTRHILVDVDGCIPCYALKKAVSQIKSNPHNVVCGMIYLPRDVTFNQLIVGSMRMLVMRTAVPFLVCFGYCFYSYMAAAQSSRSGSRFKSHRRSGCPWSIAKRRWSRPIHMDHMCQLQKSVALSHSHIYHIH